MKFASILATAVFGLSLFCSTQVALADPPTQPPPSPLPPSAPCGNPGDLSCGPVGGETCTANGCYQLYCGNNGCSLVFTPRDPFRPGNQVN